MRWVVYAKRPFAGPEAVLAYLSRYTYRVAISNSRLICLDERGVTLRWKDYRAKGHTRLMTLAPDEFIRRFLLHVLPTGFHRIRHHGCWPMVHAPPILRLLASCLRSRSRLQRRSRNLLLPALWPPDGGSGDLLREPIPSRNRPDHHDKRMEPGCASRLCTSSAIADVGQPCLRPENRVEAVIKALAARNRQEQFARACCRHGPVRCILAHLHRTSRISNRHSCAPPPTLALSAAVSSLEASPTPAGKCRAALRVRRKAGVGHPLP
jgi:hypothetical protein